MCICLWIPSVLTTIVGFSTSLPVLYSSLPLLSVSLPPQQWPIRFSSLQCAVHTGRPEEAGFLWHAPLFLPCRSLVCEATISSFTAKGVWMSQGFTAHL